MELLTTSNRGGPQKCLKTNANVDRLMGKPVVIVAASISALLTTGCVSLGAPPSPFHLVENDSPHIASVEDSYPAFISPAAVRGSDTRRTLFEPNGPLSGPLFLNQALAASNNGAWLFAPNDLVLAPPISVTTDFDPFGIDPHLWVSQTDLRLEFESVAAPGMEPATEEADFQVVPADAQPAFAAPVGTLISPVLSSRVLISHQDAWQSVMKVTAVGFLAVVMLVPMGCSFVSGVVCGQPRAGPRRRRAGRRAPDLRMSSLSRAIANIPSH